MFRQYIILLTLVFIQGCGAVFSNPKNPTHLSTCEYWPATVDVGLMLALGGVTTGLYEGKVLEDETDRYIALGVGIMYTVALLMSAATGYAEYGQCKGYLPLIQDTVEELKKPDNWLGRQKE